MILFIKNLSISLIFVSKRANEWYTKKNARCAQIFFNTVKSYDFVIFSKFFGKLNKN